MKRALLALLWLVACRDKSAKPEPRDASAMPSASVAEPAPPPSASVAAPARPEIPTLAPDKDAEISPAAQKRVDRWKKRIIDAVFAHVDYRPAAEDLKAEYARYGNVFEVMALEVPTPVMAGGADPTHWMLVVTKQGELERRDVSPVIGLVDLNGDGRKDLVLQNVTPIADMPNGPLLLKIGDKGGAFGWRECSLTTYENKPALAAVTETDSSREIGALRAGGYMEQTTKGIREEVILQWNGKNLAAVSRKPVETEAAAAARKSKYDAENAAEEARVAPARKACVERCTTEDCDGGAACAKKCKDRCDDFW